jgi:uncharacterized protein (TIGR03435 family)
MIRGIAFLVASVSAFAQAPLAFEVASVKPSGPLDPVAIQSGKMRIGMKVDGAICNIGALTLKDLIRTAYDVKDFQIAGGPDWFNAGLMNAPRFNIQATMPEGATEKQVPQMLQALLAERFKLVIHKDEKEQQVYALIVAKGGLKLTPAEPDPPKSDAPDDPQKNEPKKGETVVAGMRMSGNMMDPKGMTIKGGPQGDMHMTMADGRIHMGITKMSMKGITEMAIAFLGKPVVDMTDLKGDYQVQFDFSMAEMMNVAKAMGMGAMAGGGAASVGEASDPSGGSMFQSLAQMGLKLEQRKAPVTMIVIDHLEKNPTEN